MKLWILRPAQNLDSADDPWEPWHNKVFGFVVRAETETQAREMAQEHAGNEKYTSEGNTREPWKDPKYSSCVELLADGVAGVEMMDLATS